MATNTVHPATLDQSRFRALIADNQPAARQAISRLLEDDDSIDIVSQCSTGSEALAAIEQHSPDMLFVDVQLPDVHGFQIVESSGKIPAVVFMSALDRFAARAFDAHAADYVVKPFQDHRLVQAIQRAKLRVQMERNNGLVSPPAEGPLTAEPRLRSGARYLERLALRNGDRIFFQKVQNVDCFTSAANYVQVHCGTQQHRMRSTMSELERKLDPKQFVRIHRCTIINLECLREFRPLPHGDYLVKLVDGKELTMSRNYRQQFRHALSALSYTH
jgi:two-component system, LytTR family, response regulator